MQALEPPAVFHEVAGEPVEQFGVAWLLAQFAEVTRCIDQAAAEVVQPKAVDEHTARERMRPVGQALGQGQPSPGRGSPAIVLGDRVFIQRHHAQVGRFHGGLGLAVVAPEKKVRDRHFARLLGQRPDERLLRLGGADVGSLFGHGVEYRLGQAIAKILDLPVELLECLGVVGVFVVGEFFALGVELGDRVVEFAIVKVQRTGADLPHAWVVVQKRLVLVGAFAGRRLVGDPQRLTQFLRRLAQLPFQRALNEEIDLGLPLGIELLRLDLDVGALLPVGLGEEGDLPALRHAPIGRVKRRLEDGSQLVVVRLQDRVVTMIVALRAPNGHAHERRGDNFERLGHDLVLGCGGVRAGAGAVGCHPQKTGRGELVDLFRIQAGIRRRNHFIAGELFADKPIPRHVVVERADDVVAIAPCPAPLGVALGVALRVGVTGDVEPVASPALAVIWRSQQAID